MDEHGDPAHAARPPRGAARTGALQRSLPGISKKMLIQTLRDMEASGLMTRHVERHHAARGGVSPDRLWASRFVEPVELLDAWGRDNADALDRLVPRPTSRR